MDRCSHERQTPNRLEEALSLLHPRSRQLMQLWLNGLDRKAIETEMRLREEAVAPIVDASFQRLRVLLSR